MNGRTVSKNPHKRRKRHHHSTKLEVANLRNSAHPKNMCRVCHRHNSFNCTFEKIKKLMYCRMANEVLPDSVTGGAEIAAGSRVSPSFPTYGV